MTAKNGFPVPQRKPVSRVLSGKSVSFALAGKEQPYPVYQFSRRTFFGRPNANPFSGLGPVSITTSSPLTTATVSVAYQAQLTAEGGSGLFTWAVSSGTLPAGLALSATTGLISGTPTTPGTSIFTVEVTDTITPAIQDSVEFSLTVSP